MLRRVVTMVIVLVLLIYGGFTLIEHFESTEGQHSPSVPKLKSKQKDKQLIKYVNGDVYSWINKTKDDLLEELGDPLHKNISAYDYTWWMYYINDEYIQFGIEDDKIVTIYTVGNSVSIDPIKIGESFDKMDEKYSFKNEVTYHDGLSFYTFILSEEDIKSQPLLQLSDDLFVQCYFDTVTNELSSLRILTGDILLKHRFYEMKYRGEIPDVLTELDDEWEEIEKGIEKQIFELTNVFREHYGRKPLIWDDNISKVAYNHSKDMSKNNYFSHYRQDGSGLKERLSEGEIFYLSAGENIAAQHSDGPAAVHGWLNSEGHREALLNDDYNYLGVGVYRLYYTQNFIFKP